MLPARSSLLCPALVAFTAASCAPPAPPPGRPRDPPPRWAELATARTWPVAIPRQPSRGHAPPHFTLEVRVSPAEAADPYLALVPGQSLPVGTRVAAFHESQSGDAASVYVLTKGPSGTWEPLVTEPDGTLVQGDLTPCLTCHSDAPADSLFGPRRAAAKDP